jgi:hypothetical protein
MFKEMILASLTLSFLLSGAVFAAEEKKEEVTTETKSA